MITLKFQTLIAAIVCSVALLTSAAVPEARAGILGFLHRHLFGGSSAQRNRQPTAVSRRPSTYRTVVAHSKTGSAGHTKKAARSQRALSEQRLTMRRFPMPAPQLNFGQQARAYPSFAAQESPPGSAPFHDTTDVLDTAPLLSNMERSASLTRNHNTHRLLDSKDHAFSTRASWYGPKFDGKRTASGERFNQEGLTAASRTLPLGSKVLVANPTTGKCCTVTINDRGPYVAGRDIDLSHGAASRIGVTGVSPVICVAYANSQEESTAQPLAGPSRSVSRRRRTGMSSGSRGQPVKLSGKVMHLIAGVS